MKPAKAAADQHARASWETALDVLKLDPARTHGGPGDMAEALTFAEMALKMVAEIASAETTPTKKRDVIRRIRASQAIFARLADEGSERRGRLRLMKKAVLIAISSRWTDDDKNPHLATPIAVRIARRFAFHTVILSVLGRNVDPDIPTEMVDAAIGAAASRTGHAADRWRSLHALAKAMGCGTKDDESFRTEYSRIKINIAIEPRPERIVVTL